MSDEQHERLRLGVVTARPFRHAFVAQSLVELADQVFLVAFVWALLGALAALNVLPDPVSPGATGARRQSALPAGTIQRQRWPVTAAIRSKSAS